MAGSFSLWFDGFAETFSQMTPDMRREFGERWLSLCAPSEVAHFATVCEEMSYRDFVTELPPELSTLVLEHLDSESLLRAMQVSRAWRQHITDLSPGMWRRKSWPWPVDLSPVNDIHPYRAIVAEVQRRRVLSQRLVECKLTMVMQPTVLSMLKMSAQPERLSSMAWNGSNLLAAFPHHPQGAIGHVLNPLHYLGICDMRLTPFSVESGCRLAKFLRSRDLFVSSYSGCSFMKTTIADDNLSMATQSFQGHTNVVLDFVAPEGSNYVISLSRDHSIKVWDFNTAECLVTVNLDPTLKPVSLAAGRLAEGPSSGGHDAIAVAVYFQECVMLLLVPLLVRQILPVEGPHVLLRATGFKGPAKGDVVLLRGRSIYFTGVSSVVAIHLEFDGSGQVQAHSVNRLLLDHKSRLLSIVPFALHPLPTDADYGVMYMLSDLSIWQWVDSRSVTGRSEMLDKDRICPGIKDCRTKLTTTPVLMGVNWEMVSARTPPLSQPVAIGSPGGVFEFSSFFLPAEPDCDPAPCAVQSIPVATENAMGEVNAL